MDWPSRSPVVGQVVIAHTYGPLFVGQMGQFTTISSATWGTANKALFIPFRIPVPVLVRKLFWFNGATSSGNVDTGIYDAAGTKIVSTGSTLQGTINVIQEVDIADTLIGAGQFYLAVAMDNGATGTFFRSSWGVVERHKFAGIVQQLTAFPLPAVATFATSATDVNIPVAGWSGRVQI